jgi:cell division protease FtsH
VIANLARDMVTKYGMSEKFGPVALEATGGRLIGGGYSEDRGYSIEVAREIDEEVRRIIDTARNRAKEILTKHRSALDAVAKRLVEVETLEREEYEAILKAEGVKIEDAYRDMREREERIGDPSRALEFTPDTDTQANRT